MLTNAASMQEIVRPLYKALGINYFNFVRNYKDNSRICLTTSAQWAAHFCNEKLYLVAPFERDKDDYNNNEYVFWPTLQEHVIYQEALKSNVKHALSIVKKGKHFDEFFHFGADAYDKTTYDKILHNRDLLNYFILFFKEKAEKLIKNSHLLAFPELTSKLTAVHKIQVLDSDSMVEEANKAFDILKLKKYYLGAEFGDAYLTQKEVNILRWMIIGKTASEIAILLNMGFRTVQKHIENIKQKTNCYKTNELCYRIGSSAIGEILKKIIS
jgi:DNA-binding CsgD family transcriptional regulator